ncbi:cytochrome P450 [Artemisia annua]|uniref:Cytochrome P450 n=1 Tax=Artemisia annua TaxID=35608 RepID=A0A2U1M7V8_ARTAN|nr:cytochrome P450 [Artemisia annua]
MGAAPYGHLWRSLRRVAASELFSTTRLVATTHAREHEVKLMCAHIYKESSQKVELKSRFCDLLNNITTMAMMGKRYYGDVIDARDVKSAPRFRDIMCEMFKVMHAPYLGNFLPLLAWIDFGDAMEKIKNEINTQVGSQRLLQENDLDKLSYLQNVINESLRLYPTLPMLLPRESSEDIKIGGYLVPSGTMLMVNAWAIQRDPILWDKPDEFMPERFEVKLEDKYKMLAFGVGRRGCPGTNLGYRVLGLALGTLIQAFEWKKIGDEEVDMNAFYGMSTAKLKPLQAHCIPRPDMIPLFV